MVINDPPERNDDQKNEDLKAGEEVRAKTPLFMVLRSSEDLKSSRK
jgi:hypothetical protein